MTNELNEWAIAVDGDIIFAMPEDKRNAVIVDEPRYIAIEGDVTGKKYNSALTMNVKLTDGRIAEYKQNQTSARKIAKILNTDLSVEGLKTWKGHTIYWGQIADMMIQGKLKKVLYVTDARLIV